MLRFTTTNHLGSIQFANLKPIVLAVGIACGSIVQDALAAVTVNTASFNCANGSWTDSACWESGTIPREYQMFVYPGDKVYVLATSEDTQLNFSLNRTVTISDLGLYNDSNKVTRVVQSSGTLQVQSGSVAINGHYILSGGELSVYGNTVQDDFDANNTGTLTVGRSPTSNAAKFDLQDGTLRTSRTIVGYQGDNAIFNQQGGEHNVTYQLNVGYNDVLVNYQTVLRGTGTYNLSGGTLNAPTINVQGSSANYGYSAFNQSGGTVNGSVNLNYGVYTMTGGRLNGGVSASAGGDGRSYFYQHAGDVNGYSVNLGQNGHYIMGTDAISLTTDTTVVGSSWIGDSSFVQSGGIHTTSILQLATDSNKSKQSNAAYTLNVGILKAGDIVVGRYGVGSFTQNSGSVAVTNNLLLGYAGAVPYFGTPSSVGNYLLKSGTLIAGSETVGQYGVGAFTQSGGTNTTGALAIGQFGSYTLTAGTLTVNGALTNDGTFRVTGGNFTVSGDVINRGVWDVRSATMTYAGNTEFTSGSTNNLGTGAVATYLGAVQLRTGAQLTGNGTRIYAGGLSVGNSPGSVTQAGNAEFTSSNIYTAEIGGLLTGTGYDVFGVLGSLSFGGSLVLTSWNDFTLEVGQTYDLFNWGSSTGQFASIDFSGLKLHDGAKLDTSRLYVDGTITVTAVPEPEYAAMLLLGLGLVGIASRRRQSV